MNIGLYITPMLEQYGGCEMYFISLAEILVNRGHTVTIITLDKQGTDRVNKFCSWIRGKKVETLFRISKEDLEKELNSKGILYKQGSNIREIRLLLAEQDVIYSKNELLDLLVLWRVGKQYIKKLIIGFHTIFYNPEKGLRYSVRNFLYGGVLYRFLCRPAWKCHVLNPDAFERLSRAMPHKKVVLIENMVRVESLLYFQEESSQKNALQIDTKKKSIFWVGRLTPQKGINELIKIMQGGSKDDFHFYIAGDGEMKETLREYQDMGYCTLLGQVPFSKLPEWYSNVDIFLSTTRWESFGLSIHEANVFAKMVVIPDIFPLNQNKLLETCLFYRTTDECLSMLSMHQGSQDKAAVRKKYIAHDNHIKESLCMMFEAG